MSSTEDSFMPPTKELLEKFRGLFSSSKVLKYTANHPLAAYILPSTDAHQSEYLADVDFRVRFLSGFSGSNAYVVVTDKAALLWTDGRYFIQADKELGPGWTLMKQAMPDSIQPSDWLEANLGPDAYVGFDPYLLTFDSGHKLLEQFSKMKLNAVAINHNLVDELWENRPKPLVNKLTLLTTEETGKSVADKLQSIRMKTQQKNCTASVYGALDDIMWTLNVRGSDIQYNPLAYSYLLVTQTEAHLFINEEKLNEEIRAHLSGVIIHAYEDAHSFLTIWQEKNRNSTGHRVLVPSSTNYAIGNIFAETMKSEMSPVQVMKSVKNEVEMKGMRESHIRDSAALIEYLAWLEEELLQGNPHTEIDVAAKVDGLRAKQEKYMDLSFGTISAAGDHAALPHYHPGPEDGKRPVVKDQVYLVDSGGHYRDGTTDVTRTVWIGDQAKIPKDFIQHNTLVLKGHIHLAQTRFPDGVSGGRLDTLSRHALWQQGLDFGHGTGHGVGHFLNVHEGPTGIGFRAGTGGGSVHAGMVLTIEPGYYLPGKWGIRIENCYETVPVTVASGVENFLTFKSLTLAPIQTSIIDKSLLTSEEINWLNAYHDTVLATVGAFLDKRGKAKELTWLRNNCQHI